MARTGTRLLTRAMRSLLTGYAGAFNRRHRRVGHLFQNRHKSIVVEADRYLLELTRHIHLNPLRATLVANLRTLDRYLWRGHSALLGWVPRPWQATDEVLGHPGRPLAEVLGVRLQAVSQAGAQGQQMRAEWERLLES